MGGLLGEPNPTYPRPLGDSLEEEGSNQLVLFSDSYRALRAREPHFRPSAATRDAARNIVKARCALAHVVPVGTCDSVWRTIQL